jgi:hypothetical protein
MNIISALTWEIENGSGLKGGERIARKPAAGAGFRGDFRATAAYLSSSSSPVPEALAATIFSAIWCGTTS